MAIDKDSSEDPMETIALLGRHAGARVAGALPAAGPTITALAYLLGAQAAFAVGTLTQQFAPFWPPNVVLLCAFLLAPPTRWPLYIAVVFPAHLLAELGADMPVSQMLAAFACNVAVALLSAVVMIKLLRGPPWLGSLRNALLYLLFVVVIVPAGVALAAGFEPLLGDGTLEDYPVFWWRWYLSNALGNLTLTPIFLAWFPDKTSPRLIRPSRARLIEAALLTLALVIACALALGVPRTLSTVDLFPAVLYLPVPLVLAAAVRFGGKGASGAILVTTVVALTYAMRGDQVPLGAGHSVLSVELALAVLAIPAVLLAALVEEVWRSNQRLSGVLDGISDCYCTIGRDGRITAANAKGAAWWGAASAAALIGRDYREVVGRGAPDRAWVERALVPGGGPSSAVFLSHGRWINVHAYPSAGGLSLFHHDITEQRVAELAATEMRELLQSSLDALTAQIAILDGDGTIIAVNEAWRQFARDDDGCVPGANYAALCAGGVRHQRLIADELRRMIHGEVADFRCEYACGRREGTWLQTRGSRFGEGADLRLVVAHEDISEVKASEAALRHLTGRLMRSQDEERRRIARELHDSTAQNLLGAALGIGQAMRLSPSLDERAKAALEESRALIDQSQREIRTVSYLLHPPMLDEGGLPAALRWLCEGFGKRTEISVSLDIGSDIGRLSAPIEAALFRVAQEALTNVHRHAATSSAQIRLHHGRELRRGATTTVVLEVEDAGKGMSPDVARASHAPQGGAPGIGLAGMRERLRQFGGYLEVRSGTNGTVVTATMPVPGEVAARRGALSG